MTTAVRQMQLNGYLPNPAVDTSITIQVNNVEIFNGKIELIGPAPTPSTPPTIYPLLVADYEGQLDQQETLSMSITVNSGIVGLGPIMMNTDNPAPYNWATIYDGYTEGTPDTPENPNGDLHFVRTDDGRVNILINGVAPSWPKDGGPTLPGGTPENPYWVGWAFIVPEQHIMTFDYKAAPYNYQIPPNYRAFYTS